MPCRLQPPRHPHLRLLLCLIIVIAGCKSSHDSDRKLIEDSERQWAESVATNDSSVVERILADDFIWIAPDGTRWSKAQVVADARKGPGDFTSNHLEEVTVRFFGDTAVAQGSESWTRSSSTQRTGRFVWTDTWIRRDGRWQIVAAEDLIPTQASH
jgi:ketosteroid isomerase-like protein